MRIVILDAYATDQGDSTMWDPVRKLGDTIVHQRTLPGELLERCHDAEIVLTNKAPLAESVLQALPRLRYIGITATGTNIVALAEAARRGIAVSNVPGYSTASVAQHVFAMILHLTNDVCALSMQAKAGVWSSSPDYCFFRKPTMELHGRTLVVVGMGMIGEATASIAAAFGMRVMAAQVPGSASSARIPLSEALPQADAITLHCPLTPKTTGLVDERFLASLKAGAILINTGRGGLLNEDAVVRALLTGRLGGFCADVLTREPPLPGHPLLDATASWADRVVITPHVAWGTLEARRRLVDETAKNLEAFMRNESRNRVSSG